MVIVAVDNPYIDGLMQERRNSSVLPMESSLFLHEPIDIYVY